MKSIMTDVYVTLLLLSVALSPVLCNVVLMHCSWAWDVAQHPTNNEPTCLAAVLTTILLDMFCICLVGAACCDSKETKECGTDQHGKSKGSTK